MRRTVMIIAGLVAGMATARADQATDEQLRQIEWELDHYQVPTSWDGSRFKDDADPAQVEREPRMCEQAFWKYNQYWARLPADVKAAPRARTIQQRVDKLRPVCTAMAPAARAFVADAAARKARAEEEAKLEAARTARRGQFFDAIAPQRNTVRALLKVWDPELDEDAIPMSFGAADAAKYRQDLIAIDQVCRASTDVTDAPRPSRRPWDRPRAVCAMAAAGADVVVKKGHLKTIRHHAEGSARSVAREAEQIISGEQKSVSDLMQKLAYDRAAWFAVMAKGFNQAFAELGTPVPDDLFAAAEAVAPRLRARLEENAGNDAFEQPPYRDAQVERLVRKQVAADYPGATIVKIGTSYKTWLAFDERTWVKSDANYDYYRVNKGKNRYKRGWILVKLPGQPLCQAREFIVRRVRSGKPVVDSLDGGGLYVRCE